MYICGWVNKNMARKSTIPESILQYRPCKCARIRNDNGVYRVYKYSAVKLKSGKWSSSGGYLIGKIIPNEGFIANKRYLKELELSQEEPDLSFSNETTDICYGNYALLMELSKDIRERLIRYFQKEKALQIYCYALILCANGFAHIDQINEYYQESYLSVVYRKFSFKMGHTALTNLLHDLGMKGHPVRNFEQSLIDESSKNIAIDGHVIKSDSVMNDLAEAGYKSKQLKSDQINILIAYDTKVKQPLAYRTYRGSMIDKKSCEEFLKNFTFKNTNFVVDKGFFSKNILKKMSSDGNSYIIPVPKSNKELKKILKTLTYSSGEFLYRGDTKYRSRVVFYEKYINKDTRIIVFKNIDENNRKRGEYMHHINLGDNGYTKENYDKLCEWWGVYQLQTTSTASAQEIFSDYKDRWSIETYNNYVKNEAEFNNLKIQNYYVAHGFDFIMLITGLIHARFSAAIKKLKDASLSTIDVLLKSSHMRMVQRKETNTWELHNTRTKDIAIFSKLGFVPQKSLTI